MTSEVDLLRDSFALAADHEPALIERFYEELFRSSPELKPMFRRDPAAQAEMLRAALQAVLEHIEDAPWMETTLSVLGAKHKEYGVTAPMYDAVGAALIKTLATILHDHWSPRHEQAWANAYNAVRRHMLAGAKTAAA